MTTEMPATRRWLLSAAIVFAPFVPGRFAGAQGGPTIDGPPRPVAPAVISRDANGQATVRAIKLKAPLRVDGVLDEDVYKNELPFGGLIQVAPDYGAVSTERSDIWITYDDENIYLTCRCYDSAPPDQWVVNELRRDTGGLRNNEHIGILFDTFYDRRSGFAFYTNPLGARADYSVVDEGGSNTDWNPVWTSKTGRFDGGWTVEMAIPFKSLRYRAGPDKVWGVQIRRSIRHKNEWTYLTPVPRILAGPQALNKVSAGGTLVGLDLPDAGKNIEVKPYGISRVATDKVRVPALHDKFSSEAGADLKYGLTANLTADATFNTDFAQVEIDEQQVNLTRFSLLFPEKRDFFLEGRGIFDFARGAQGAVTTTTSIDQPYLFYTRRIGLNNSSVIHINEGGRVTGKLGPYSIGVMDIQTAADAATASPPTNFSVLRLKRDILKRSMIGIMATNRSAASTGTGSNQAYGVDGTFILSQDLTAGTYWARTETTGKPGDDQSYQGQVDYAADKYGAHVDYMAVGTNFDPQVGFRRRFDFNRTYGQLRFSPRPTSKFLDVRKYTWTASEEYIQSGSSGRVDARIATGHFGAEFNNSDQFTVDVTQDYEFLPTAFTPAGSPAAIAAGGYTFPSVTASYQFGAQRRASGAVTVQAGQYYDGNIRSITFGPSGMNNARLSILQRLAMEPTITITRIERPVPGASFTTKLARTRIDYAFSPLMFASALLQYSSADRAFATNLRYRWEYAPGSELFLVYTDERDMTEDRFLTPTTVRGLKNRTFVVKINRLFRS